MMMRLLLLASLASISSSFVVVPAASVGNRVAPLQMMDPSMFVDVTTVTAATTNVASSMLLADTEEWVQPLALVLDPFLNLFSFAMLCRIVLSWYPKQNVTEFPFVLVVWPTESLLRAIRGAVPPAFGVDITPIVWLAIFTFFHEILLGQQGLLTMKLKYGI